PKAPALPRTEAPQVPGTPMANSRPPSPRAAQSSAVRGIIAPPGSSTMSSESTLIRSRGSSTTRPRMPPSRTRLLLPAPITVRGTPLWWQRRITSARWAVSPTLRYQSAGPPIPYWLWRSRGSSRRAPGRAASQVSSTPAPRAAPAGQACPGAGWALGARSGRRTARRLRQRGMDAARDLVEAAQGEHEDDVARARQPEHQLHPLVAAPDQVHLPALDPGGDVGGRDGRRLAALPGRLDGAEDDDVRLLEAA